MPTIPMFIGAANRLPRTISNLFAWYETSLSSSLTLSGNEITQFLDLSGNSRNTDVQGTSTQRPTWSSNQINGLSCATFDGGDKLILPSSFYSLPNADSTLFVVATTSLDTTKQNVFTLNAGNVHGLLLWFTITSGNVAYENRNTDSTSPATFSPVTKANANIYIGTHYTTATNQFLQANNATTSQSTNGENFTATQGAIGVGGNSLSTLFLTGKVAEIIVYNRALSAGEQAIIRQYLAIKWGIGL